MKELIGKTIKNVTVDKKFKELTIEFTDGTQIMIDAQLEGYGSFENLSLAVMTPRPDGGFNYKHYPQL